jgi:hypothetical protein
MARSKLLEIADAFAPWRQLHRRDAWRPITEDRPGLTTDSRFGGLPLLQKGETWPECGGCHRPMQLLLQLDLQTLPEACLWRVQDGGLLQFFYCTYLPDRPEGSFCPAEDEKWQPLAGAGKLLRVIRSGQQDAPVVPEGFVPFPSRVIVGWEHFDDYPSPEEHERLGLKYVYDFQPGITITSVEWPEGNVRFPAIAEPNDGSTGVAETVSGAAPRDKLGGWPNWVQSADYPACPLCGQPMQYVFQIDSEDHVPYMFGDVGCGHITRCAQHADVLAFGWACS